MKPRLYRFLGFAMRENVLKLLLRKLIQGLLMLLAVSAITFVLLSKAGGDAFSSLRDNPQVSEATIERLRIVYGLDKPLAARYGNWLTSALRGNLGESFQFSVPVASLVWIRFLNTLLLAGIALLIAIVLSAAMSILSVRLRNAKLSAAIEFLILVTSSTPRIVLALFALALTVRFSGLALQTGNFSSIILAAIVLAIPLISLFLAQTHESLSQAMKEDFIKLARAKGLSEFIVIFRHASRAAIGPLLTLFGLSLGALLGGSVIVETVLGWPGIGALMVAAVRSRDLPVVMGVVLAASAAVWFGNALAEVLQMTNDKRLR
ncbi:MAG: ABC transporter permease [Saprospiraceae bacterium]|nr:ABC transporter permease [Pyrinomonadaceae bacterium]